jgi:hypothetical protein
MPTGITSACQRSKEILANASAIPSRDPLAKEGIGRATCPSDGQRAASMVARAAHVSRKMETMGNSTDLKRLTNRMEELAQPAGALASTMSNTEADSPRAATS